MPSNHLILCHPLLLPPSIFPSIRVFSNESALCIRWPKYWRFRISPSNEYSRLISFSIDWFDLLASKDVSLPLRSGVRQPSCVNTAIRREGWAAGPLSRHPGPWGPALGTVSEVPPLQCPAALGGGGGLPSLLLQLLLLSGITTPSPAWLTPRGSLGRGFLPSSAQWPVTFRASAAPLCWDCLACAFAGC